MEAEKYILAGVVVSQAEALDPLCYSCSGILSLYPLDPFFSPVSRGSAGRQGPVSH